MTLHPDAGHNLLGCAATLAAMTLILLAIRWLIIGALGW